MSHLVFSFDPGEKRKTEAREAPSIGLTIDLGRSRLEFQINCRTISAARKKKCGAPGIELELGPHAWLCSLGEPDRLSQRVRGELADRKELSVSPVSTGEALMLHAERRIEICGDLVRWLARATEHLHETPLTHEIVGGEAAIAAAWTGSWLLPPGCAGDAGYG